MSLSVLEIEKGADELRKPFHKRIDKLKELEQVLLNDDKVQLYIFLHGEISKLTDKENEELAIYYNDVRKECEHPLYLCVTDGSDFGYSYKCICLNCGHTEHFKQYELDELFADHRVIAQKMDYRSENGKDTHYYLALSNMSEASEYYKECCKHILELNQKLKNDDMSSIEEAASEMTFNYFVFKDKDKKSERQYVKRIY